MNLIHRACRAFLPIGVVLFASLFWGPAFAQGAVPSPATAVVTVNAPGGMTNIVRLTVLLTALAFVPGAIICLTPFLRLIIALSMIRHAFGMPETPPTPALVSIALLLTMIIMAPIFTQMNHDALTPFMDGRLNLEQAIDRGTPPLRGFMLRQVHDQDLKAVYEMARKPLPARAADVGITQLATAFILNELRVAFRIGFLILLPFLLIDVIVASILLSLGMLMVPPATLSLPIKVLMFVLIDGWSMILGGVVGSFR